MPQVIPLVAMAAAKAAGLGTFWTGFVVAASSVAAGMIQQRLASKNGTNEAAGRQIVIRSSNSPHDIVVGRYVKSGTLLFADATGDDNKYMHLVIGLVGDEIEEIGDIWVNDELLVGSDMEPYIRINKHLGSPDQVADADLVAESDLWTDNHRLQGIAYIYVRLTWPGDKTGYDIFPNGLPNFKADIKGIKLYDPRTSQRVWSDNMALVVREYLTADWGMGCGTDEIDEDAIIAAANICDELIDNGPLIDLDTLEYDWQFKSSLEGFLDSPRGTLAALDEYMSVIATDTNQYIYRSDLSLEGGDNRFIRMKIRRVVAVTWEGQLRYRTVNHDYSDSYYAAIPEIPLDGEFHYLEIDMWSLAAGGDEYKLNTVTGLQFEFSDDANAAIDVEFIQVGSRSDHKRYTCNGVFSLDQYPADIVEALLSAGVGSLFKGGGKYHLSVGAYGGSEIRALTVDDLRDELTIQPRARRDNLFNAVQGTYISPDDSWQSTDFPTVTNALYETEDGEQLLADIQLPFTTDPVTAQRIAKIHLERARQGIVMHWPGKPELMRYLTGDVVPVTVDQLGYDNKLFRIIELSHVENGGGVDLVLQEEAPEVYDWNHGEATKVDPAPNTNLPDPSDCPAPTGLATESGDAQMGLSADGTLFPRILVSWNSTSGWFVTGYRVEWQRVGDSSWTGTDSIDEQCHISPVVTGERYNIRVRALNGVGGGSAWTTLYNYTVVGKTAKPATPSSFTVFRQPDGTRQFDAEYSSKPIDFSGYRIYYRLGTGHTINDMDQLNLDGLITAMPYESNQLAAGEYTFALVAVDTSKIESDPLYIVSTLGDPRLGDVIYAEYPASQGWPGTKTDCHVDNNSWLAADSNTDWSTGTWADIGVWNHGAISPIVYQHPTIDLGFEAVFTPLISAIGDGDQTIEVNTSSDNVLWSGWGVPALVTARYLQVRITVTGTAPLIKRMPILLSGKALQDEISDLDTSTLTGNYRIGTGDIRLPQTKAFNKISQVQLALQSVGAGWTWSLVDKSSADALNYGPRIQIFDGNGNLADAVIDATIKGV